MCAGGKIPNPHHRHNQIPATVNHIRSGLGAAPVKCCTECDALRAAGVLVLICDSFFFVLFFKGTGGVCSVLAHVTVCSVAGKDFVFKQHGTGFALTFGLATTTTTNQHHHHFRSGWQLYFPKNPGQHPPPDGAAEMNTFAVQAWILGYKVPRMLGTTPETSAR